MITGYNDVESGVKSGKADLDSIMENVCDTHRKIKVEGGNGKVCNIQARPFNILQGHTCTLAQNMCTH